MTKSPWDFSLRLGAVPLNPNSKFDDGTTVALAGVAADQIRPLPRNEIRHARPFTLAAH